MRKGMTAMNNKTKRASKRSQDRFWEYEGENKPIKPYARAKIFEWLNLPEGERAANHKLLTAGLPSGAIRFAHFQSNPDRMEVKVSTMVGSPPQNTPRVFDLATFAMMRLLTAFDGTYRVNNNSPKEESAKKKRLHYVDVTLCKPISNVSIGILIWGSRTLSPVRQVSRVKPLSENELIGTFCDWTLANLQSKDNSDPLNIRHLRNRAAVLDAALVYRTAYELSVPTDRPQTESEYRDAIEKCFTLLDGLREAVLKQRADRA
jgi:hypothetical protein